MVKQSRAEIYGPHSQEEPGTYVKDGELFRYGYRIGNAAPRYVGHVWATFGKPASAARDEALNLAERAAVDAREELARLGAPTEVTYWIQKRTSITEIGYSEAEVVDLNKASDG